jgi:prophage DNA circulation protein
MNIDPNTIIIAIGVLALVVLILALTKIQALSKSIQRLSEQIPGTGMTAKELGAELGGSIESSFQKFMPQPEKVSSAITSAVEASMKKASADLENLNKKFTDSQQAVAGSIENALKNVVSQMEGVNKKLTDGQASVLEKWVAHEKNSATGLDGIRKALESASQQMGQGLTGGSDKMLSTFDGGSKKLADTLGAVSAKLDASLQDHADKTTKASAQLSAQLEKIVAMEKEIEKVLHLQQTTEGTLKSVAASEEFKTLVKALRDHLQASDAVLREVAKPRTIRLVESDS